MKTPPTISALIDTCNDLADALSDRLDGVPADDPSVGLDLILIDRARALTAAAAAPLPDHEDDAAEPAAEPADCYYDYLLNAEAQATDQEWIDAAYSEEDRSHRQDIRDRSLDSARERLLQLRRFALIIAQASRVE